VAAIAVSAILLLVPGPALAGTLDQQQTALEQLSYTAQGRSLAQSFTAGITGGLDQVDIALSRGLNQPAAYVSVEIRDVSNGVPGSSILASNSFTSTDIPVGPADSAWFSVNFAPAAPVVAGTQYAVVIYTATPDTAPYDWRASNPYDHVDRYPAGTEFLTNSSPPTGQVSWLFESDPTLQADFAFKTYVVPTPAPSPPAQAGPLGQRAAALKKCKRKHGKKRKRCIKRAKRLPV
jgi:hypothetical protein